jgi:response regulator RpfG family c-di-GMP phosphodiesterase
VSAATPETQGSPDAPLHQAALPFYAGHQTAVDPVLVVDDEHGVRDLMVRWLRLTGYPVFAAATADDAFERVQHEIIGVALVDVHMPGHDGHWLAEQLRRRSPDIAVIMVTGMLDVGGACNSLQHGVIDYLVKPFTRDRLREAVQRGFDWHYEALEARRWRERLDEETQRLRRSLSEAFAALNITSYESLEAVLRVLTLRDREIYEHAHRVEELSLRLARHLSRPDAEVDTIRRAALLHDIGRLALPPSLFRKPGPLSSEEQILVREGPHFAYELLRDCAYLTSAAELVRRRHERFDGRGFPGAFAGDAIPLGSRILAIADSYDTMLTARAYRDPVTPAEALAELQRCAGREFDPTLVRLFATLLREH